MQLFSRKKTSLVLSLGALAALGACGDDVTVPVAPAAPVVISITPPSASMNVGEALTFAVQISGGTNATNTTAPTLTSCTSSSATVATATVSGSACRVTAVAAGNATITATASTGQTAAAAISVSAPPAAITSLAVSPSAAQLAVGQNVSLVPTVQPSGRAATYTYATSSATIATVTAAGVVTAVAPGVATITVTATGSGTGFSTATIAQAVTITVSDRAPGLTSLTVQPSTVSLALGGTQQLTSSVQGPRASAATTTYLSSAPTVASVSSTGVVTALTAGTAVIGVTVSSVESGAFAASSITALVPVTVTPAAQVVITSIQRSGTVIDISNVFDQIEVNLSIQPNNQNVSEANVWVCNQGETVAACAARTNGVPAARQSFTAAGAQASVMQLYINTAEFDVPNFTTGADANTLYKNGLKTIVATLTTTPNAVGTIASNSISQLNFNNPDGWTIEWTQPTTKANDANGRTWFGGPTTADALVPAQANTTGRSTFTMVPVVYTQDRTVVQATLGITGLTCGRDAADNLSEGDEPITLYARPFRGSMGVQTRDTLTGAFNCEMSASDIDGVVPAISGIDNRNNSYGVTTGGNPATQQQIYNDFITLGGQNTNRYRQSLAFRRTTTYIPMDYQAPQILGYDVRGGGATPTAPLGSGWVDSAWVNGTYVFAGGFARIDTVVAGRNLRAGDPLRLAVQDVAGGVGVGLLGSGPTTSARNTRFNVCNTASVIPVTADTVRTECATPVKTAMIMQTVGQVGLDSSLTNLTNGAYFVQVVETDKLGNRARSNPFPYTRRLPNNTQTVVAATPAFNEVGMGATTHRLSAQAFGVDLAPPTILAIPDPSASETAFNPAVAGVRSGIDSIFSTLNNTYQRTTAVSANDVNISATNALFAVRVRDERSGFYNCTQLVNAQAFPGVGSSCAGTNGNVNMGQFQIERRTPQLNPLASNDALIQNIIQNTVDNEQNGTFGRYSTVIEGQQLGGGGDPSVRQFTINIWGGNANRARPSLQPAVAVARDGYYTFSGTLVDRAGNTTTIPARRVAIDNSAPTLNNLILPAVFQGGQNTPVTLQASDNLEVMGADMNLAWGGGVLPINVKFHRVTNFAPTIRAGLFHNPFAALTDGKLATPTGVGQFYTGNVAFPIPFIQDLQLAAGGAVPAIPGAPNKPTALTAQVFDIRAMWSLTGYTAPTTSGTPNIGTTVSAPITQAIAANQVSQSTFIKNWGLDVGTGPTFNQGAGIDRWELVTSTATSAEWRARAVSSLTNIPFTSVAVVTRRLTTPASLTYESNYEYRGNATFAGVVNEGGQRYFRYTWTAGGAVAQGAGSSVFAFANGDSVRAIGMDASGNAIASDASLPGQVATVAVITGITVQAVHLSDGVAALPANGVNPVIADFNIFKTRNNVAFDAITAPLVVQSPRSISSDARIFIARAAANGTARVWFTLAQPNGAPIASSAITTVACTTTSPDLAVVSTGWATQIGATTPQAYCDIRGATGAENQGTILVTATQAASGPFAGSGAANANLTDPIVANRVVATTLNTVLWTGVDAVTTANYGAAGAVVESQPVGTTNVSTFPVAAPTFAGVFNASNVTMEYTPYFGGTNRYTGVTLSASSNTLTGAGTITATCGTTFTIRNQTGVLQPTTTAIPVVVQARAVSALGYSNPTIIGTVNVDCTP